MPVALTRRAKLLMPICLLLLVALSVWRLDPGGAPTSESRLAGKSMGTTYSVVVAGAQPAAGLAEAVQASLDRVEQQMSTYIGDSELMRFNRSRETGPVAVSKELAAVVEISLALSAASGGALDVTVRPLVALWGFGASAQQVAPSDSELSLARARVGSQHLRLEQRPGAPPTLSKAIPELEIDLSAVAKGYAVDQLALMLEQRGIYNYMVEVGGEVRVGGTKANKQLWRIGIEKPDDEGRAVQQAIALTNQSMATSGDYRNFYEREGRRISHTIDPRDGRPISHGLASVSVLHKSAAWADGWATALNVLGPKAGRELAESQGLAALFIARGADGSFQSIPTAAFSQLTAGAQLATPPEEPSSH